VVAAPPAPVTVASFVVIAAIFVHVLVSPIACFALSTSPAARRDGGVAMGLDTAILAIGFIALISSSLPARISNRLLASLCGIHAVFVGWIAYAVALIAIQGMSLLTRLRFDHIIMAAPMVIVMVLFGSAHAISSVRDWRRARSSIGFAARLGWCAVGIGCIAALHIASLVAGRAYDLANR
jgi:hypothetical protein